MKLIKYIALLLFGLTALWAQPVVKVIPNVSKWKAIHAGYKLGGTYITSTDTSDAFKISQSSGDMVLWLNTATDGLSTPNTGDLKIYLQLYSSAAESWGIYPMDSDSSLFVTVPASLVNVSNSKTDLYIPLGDYSEWYWADKVRFIFEITSGQQLYIDAWIGGQ